MIPFDYLKLTSLAVYVLLSGCALNPLTPASHDSYHYSVAIPSLDTDSLHIRLDIHLSKFTDSIHLLAPAVYADNPWLQQTGFNFHNLSITDCKHIPVPFSTDSIYVGLYPSLHIACATSDSILSVTYDVTFNYSDTQSIPAPYINEKNGYLQGSYIFMIPFDNSSSEITAIWHSPFDLQVTYHTGQAVSLMGDPIPKALFRTPYELLFSTSALNGDIIAQGEADGQQFRFICLGDTNLMGPMLTEKAVGYMNSLLTDILSDFKPLNGAPMTVIFGINNSGGLEGMHAFSILNLGAGDTNGWFGMILAHEILHYWVGVRVGDYEDPWWKEGTTSYLGYLYAIRNKVSTSYFIGRKLLADLSADNAVNKFALGDPQVRQFIYASENNCERLVYDKGAQVTMLFDRRIRDASNNATSLDKIVAEFVNKYDGKAFYRADYAEFIKKQSGADITDLISQFVLTTGAIPDSALKENADALIAMGAFGDSIRIRQDSRDWSPGILNRW